MRIVRIGGSPAGLYFELLMRKRHPEHILTVIERNKPYDTFGWGVVFSDAMMSAMRAADPESAAEIANAFNHWDDIELVFKGSRQRTTGHGFIGIGRKQLLNILQRRCEALGVELAFEREVDSDLEFPDADLIVAADGFNSKIRHRYADQFRPDLLVRPNRYIWLCVAKPFDAFAFDFRKTEHGWFQAHIYKFDREASTFIVETTGDAFEAHGLGELDQEGSIVFCEKIFDETLDGAKLMTNARHLRGSAWLNFNRLICAQWSCFNGRSHVVLMGDAAHTAHFAIGSCTKLAFDDAIELRDSSTRVAIRRSISQRRAPLTRRFVAATSRASRTRRATQWNGLKWLASATATRSSRHSSSIRCRRARNASATRAYGCATRSGWKVTSAGSPARPAFRSTTMNAPPPMLTPYRVRGHTLKNPVVVSPMTMYSAKDGLISDFHLAHLGARALGGRVSSSPR